MPRLTRIVRRLTVRFKSLNKESYSRHDTQNRAKHTEFFKCFRSGIVPRQQGLSACSWHDEINDFCGFFPFRLEFLQFGALSGWRTHGMARLVRMANM